MLIEATLINDCLSPKGSLSSEDKKPFHKGDKVVGRVVDIKNGDSKMLGLQTVEGYIIPDAFVEPIGEFKGDPNDLGIQDAEYYEEESIGKKAVSDSIQKVNPKNLISSNSMRSKKAVQIGVAGGLLGLVVAMIYGKNKLISTGIGAFGGMVVGNYISEIENK